MNKYEQIKNWLYNYQPISSNWIYFNVTNYEAGYLSLNSVSMSRYLSKDVLGNKTVELVFAIDMIKDYDIGTSDNNLDALQEIINFNDWIDTNKNALDLGSNVDIIKIEALSNVPSISIDTNQNLAKYQFQAKITYYEREE